MSEYIEYTIKIKDEKSSLSEKDISYEALLLCKENERLKSEVDNLVYRFKSDNPSQESPGITVNAKMVWQS